MKPKFPIYIDEESMLHLAENMSKSMELIFLRRADVYIEMTEKKYEEIFETEPSDFTNVHELRSYANQIGITIRPHTKKFNIIRNTLYEKFSSLSGCVFILNLLAKEAKQFRIEYGLWVISKEELHDDSLVLESIEMTDEDQIPGAKYEWPDKNGWKKILGDRLAELPPFNEIIVYDNFLKQYSREYNQRPPYEYKEINHKNLSYGYIGLENLLFLFDAILPVTHKIKIKILVVIPKFTESKYEEKLEERLLLWMQEVKSLRQFQISVSAILIGARSSKESHPIHPRALYTNFFRIKTEKGFKLFEPYPYSETIRRDGDSKNSISLCSYFSSPRQRSNPIEVDFNSKLKDIYFEIKKVVRDSQDVNVNTIIGDDIESSNNNYALFDFSDLI